jgi:hypothetical protein
VARLATHDQNRTKPWKAEVKFRGVSRFLGYFETKEEAEEAERAMRLKLTGVPHPTRRINRGY